MNEAALALALALACCSTAAYAGDPPQDATENIVAIQINGKPALDSVIVQQSPDGDIWLDIAVWSQFEGVTLNLASHKGQVSARELGLDPRLDTGTQTVNLKVPAAMLPTQGFAPVRERVVEVAPQPIGAFINYDLAGVVREDGGYSVSAAHDLRMGVGPGTLVTTGQLNSDGAGVDYVRGMTTVHYDHLPSGTAMAVGDVFSPRSNLGGAVNLGGVRIGSDRSLRSELSYYPVPVLGGIAQQAATAEVFVNGNRTGQHSVRPGPWSIDQYPIQPGNNAINVVVRDDFGREEVIQESFYLSPDNLPKGMTEWEVAAGLVRREDSYGAPAAVGTFNRGMTDAWTLGATISGTEVARSVSLSNRVVLGSYGALGIDASKSSSEQGSGHAAALSYSYRADDWSVRAGHTRYSEAFWSLGQDASTPAFSNRRLASTTSLGVSLHPKGAPWSASASAVEVAYHDGRSSQRFDLAARYRTQRNSFGVGVSHNATDGDTQAYVSWQHSFDNSRSISASVRAAPDVTAQVRMNGRGEVAGRRMQWNAGLQSSPRSESAWGEMAVATPKGDARARVIYDSEGKSEVTGRFEGSIWIGEGGVMAQRPGRSSFLLVEVPGQGGVPIAAGSGYNSTTNARGFALVPSVHPLAKQTARMDGTDVGLEVGLETTSIPYTVGRHGGGKVAFMLLSNNMLELRLTHKGEPIGAPAKLNTDLESVPVGMGGVAVLMSAEPGQQLSVAMGDEGSCEAQLPDTLPDFETILTIDCQGQTP